MPAFQYAALDHKGRQRKGLIEADTPRLARQALRERGLNPLGVEEVASQERRRGRQWWSGQIRISAADLERITRHLKSDMAPPADTSELAKLLADDR